MIRALINQNTTQALRDKLADTDRDLTLVVDRSRDFACVFVILCSDAVDVAVGLAAAILLGESAISDGGLSSEETIL